MTPNKTDWVIHNAREIARSKTVVDKDIKLDISIWDGAADANCRERAKYFCPLDPSCPLPHRLQQQWTLTIFQETLYWVMKQKKKKSSRHLHVWMIFNLKTCKAIADSEWKRPAVTEETFQKFQNGQRKSKWEKLSETSEVKRSQMFSRLNWPKACRYFRQPHDLKMETEQQREREMEKEQRNSRAGKWVTKAELWAPCLVTVL